MDKKHTISGYSDDILCVDIEDVTDEFDQTNGIIACSDGTVLKFDYDGYWRFKVIRKGILLNHIVSYNEDDLKHEDHPDLASYSDIVVFKSKLNWITVNNIIKRPGQLQKEIY
jgi:hypothetical protein